MAPTLYHITASPPARAVRMTAKAIGLDLNLKELDFLKGEHLSEWFLKINPQHTVPTFVEDDGFSFWDSHAIMAYIVSKYAKDDSLYPKDLKKRALIDQRLHFDSSNAFVKLHSIMKSLIHEKKGSVDQASIDGIKDVYQLLETFLEGRQWIAGDSVSIADYALIATVSSLSIFLEIDAKKYPKLQDWLKRAEALPGYDVNKVGREAHKQLINSFLGKK